jgi:D-methionine transport system substrate-binding protein
MNLTKWKKTLGAALAVLVFAGLAAGCGSDKKQAADKKELTFSKSQGPYSDLFEKGVKPILEKKGYKITGKDMSDLLQADIALNEGEVDFNVEQHTAYMENFNKKQGGHLVALTPIPTVPAGIYAGSKTSLDQVADGDTIRFLMTLPIRPVPMPCSRRPAGSNWIQKRTLRRSPSRILWKIPIT